MTHLIDDLDAAVRRADRLAGEARTRAGLVRAAADLDWHGPGSAAYREQVVARWQGLLEVAGVAERLATRLAQLRGEIEAA